MRCHYEVLEVEKEADDDTIKKAYRKLALKWHPDKNPDRIEECTQYFALLQQAYEVLSDPHERAFYDKHRDSILKGGFGEENYEDKSIDLFQYFTSTCYKGFDGPKGFFEVYKEVFARLAEEDYEYLDGQAQKYPSFGSQDSDYNEITGPFYGFWSSFCTARSFHWLDKYDIRQAENRYQSRVIEAENKKFRDTGKAERNEQIRELVAFVRKRDPRIKAYREQLELRQLEAKKRQEENRRNQIRKNQELYQTDDILAQRHREHFESLLAEEESVEEDEELDDETPHCVVCNKSFKTPNALESHKNSKLHKKQLAEMMRHMKEEDAAIFEELAGPATPLQTEEKKGKKAKRRAKKKKAWDETDSEGDDAENVEEVAESEAGQETESIEAAPAVEEKKVKKSRRAKKGNRAWDEEFGASETEKIESLAAKIEDIQLEGKAESNKTKKKQELLEKESIEPKAGKCEKCGEFFESRTKLFQHIRETGHASLKYSAEDGGAKKNRKGKRK